MVKNQVGDLEWTIEIVNGMSYAITKFTEVLLYLLTPL